MRLNPSRTSRAEDRIEKWMTQHHQERVLAGETTPKGRCPDEQFLNNLARKSKRIVLSDPRVDHAATCSSCMKRLLEIRQDIYSRRRRVIATVSVVSCLTFTALFIVALRYRAWERLLPSSAVVVQTVDLWNVGAYRGAQASTLGSVSLPAAKVRATVILPAFSTPGEYLVRVARNQNGEGTIAEGQSLTEAAGNQERVQVDLDLRGVKAGSYFLSTMHEQDQASYYYPLEIK
jgi:hypothetical protein